MPSQTFSHHKLTTLQACRRRFQLRYLDRLAWPAGSADRNLEQALLRGQRFHQLLHGHFLGLDVGDQVGADPALERWWRAFLAYAPALPPGKRLPELQLTVPVGDHLLAGRFDLLVMDRERWHIFDWKTEARPRSAGALRQSFQSRLYLALAVEGSPALGRRVAAEQVSLTYWQANAPEAPPVTFTYDDTWHKENWTALLEMVAEVDQRLAQAGDWPLTENLDRCRRCPYQVLCDRQMPDLDLSDWALETEEPSLTSDGP